MGRETEMTKRGRPKGPALSRRKEGIKVEIDLENAQWWTRDGAAYIERIASPEALRPARSYVRNGKVLDVSIEPGLVEAKVQGRRKQPYHVRLYFAAPGEEQLSEIRRRLSERALYGASLLLGEVPEEIQDIFIASGSSLLTFGATRERFLCSCSEPHDLCKHIIAALYAVVGAFDRNPFLLLKLRGLEDDDLLASILAPRGNGEGARYTGAHKDEEQAPSFEDAAGDQPPPLDKSFYGDEAVCLALEAFRSESSLQAGIPKSLQPLFDFPLWRGEISFRESIDPYYESVRKLLRGK